MVTSVERSSNAIPTRLGSLPMQLRLLVVCPSPTVADQLAEALAGDRATKVFAESASDAESALARLRDKAFDALALVHIPGVLDALDLTEAIRGMGIEEPILVLGNDDAGDFAALVYEIGGDAYLHASSTSTRTLLWTLSRAMERSTLVRENRRLSECEKNRLRQEQDDVRRLLADQQMLVRTPCEVPTELKEHYRELLRTQVIMGAGNLTAEIESLALMLAGGKLTADQALSLHLEALEDLIRGLGPRSARHIMARADLLLIDLLARLAQFAADTTATP